MVGIFVLGVFPTILVFDSSERTELLLELFMGTTEEDEVSDSKLPVKSY